jgi:hypothetical protein
MHYRPRSTKPIYLFYLHFFSCDVQKVKSSIKYKTITPEWNEELTLSITNMMLPVKIVSSSTFTMGHSDM